MKNTMLLCAFVLFSFVSAHAFADTANSLREQCFDQVVSVTGPKLESLRDRMQQSKAVNGKNYYEVYSLYKGFYLNSSKFTPLKKLADEVSLSATFAVQSCIASYGDMGDGTQASDQSLGGPSANAVLKDETLPKINAFYERFDKFITQHYNVQM